MPIISLRNVSFRYPGQRNPALSGLSLDINEGESLLVLGGDGSGKSTLCRALNGLIPHETKGELSGEVLVHGKSTRTLRQADIVRSVGLALQDPEVQLFTDSVEEEVAFGPENFGTPVAVIEANVSNALKIAGLSSLREKSPSALSGGQKQRLAIASVLSMTPEVMVLDEPISMLDPRGRAELLQMLDELRRERGMTVIMTSQEVEEVTTHCDRIALLHQGSLVGVGTPSEMLASSERLKSLAVDPPQLLALSESLSGSGISPAGRTFFEEKNGLSILSGLLPPRRA